MSDNQRMSPLAKPKVASTPKVNRVDLVAGELSNQIRSGTLAPGTRLPGEHATAERFGVSRTVVREAIARLKTEGLVTTRQGDGAFVSEWRAEVLHLDPGISEDLESVLMIDELRKGLEAEAAALAAIRHTRKEIAAIDSARLRASNITAARGDSVVADIAFHRRIAEATHNPYYVAVLDYLSQFVVPAVRASRGHAALREDFAREVDAEHLDITDAIRRRDSEAARTAAQVHMDHALERIRRAGSEVLPSDASRRRGKTKVPRPAR